MSTTTTTRPTKGRRSSAEDKSATTENPAADTEVEIDPQAGAIDLSKTMQTSPPDCESNGQNDVIGACGVGRTSSAFLARQNNILTLLTTIIMLMRTYWV